MRKISYFLASIIVLSIVCTFALTYVSATPTKEGYVFGAIPYTKAYSGYIYSMKELGLEYYKQGAECVYMLKTDSKITLDENVVWNWNATLWQKAPFEIDDFAVGDSQLKTALTFATPGLWGIVAGTIIFRRRK